MVPASLPFNNDRQGQVFSNVGVLNDPSFMLNKYLGYFLQSLLNPFESELPIASITELGVLAFFLVVELPEELLAKWPSDAHRAKF